MEETRFLKLREVIKSVYAHGPQKQAADALGVNQNTFNRWLNGTGRYDPNQSSHRDKILDWLFTDLKLKEDPQTFQEVWQEIVGWWNWIPLSNEESAKYISHPVWDLYINVPLKPKHHKIVGQEEFLADCKNRLLNDESLGIAGMAGIGKTTLTWDLIRDDDIVTHFKDAILWASLGQNPDIMSVLKAWADGLRIDIDGDGTGPEELKQKIASTLSRRRVLIVIDDVWDKNTLEGLNVANPRSSYIITSRDIRNVIDFLDSSQLVTVPLLSKKQAVNLFQNLVPTAYSAAPDAAQELVGRLGGLPLAIMLLGGFLGLPSHDYSTPETTLLSFEQISSPLRWLQLAQKRIGMAGTPEMTLQQVIQLSIDHLPDKSYQDTFHALGTFAPKPTRFDWAAAQEITESNATILNFLIDRYLVEKYDQSQLALHQILHLAAERNTKERIKTRHRIYYLNLAGKDPNNWKQIEKIYGQIKWAWKAAPEDKYRLNFTWNLETYQTHQGFWEDLKIWSKKNLDLAKAQGWQAEVAKVLRILGSISIKGGEYSNAQEYLQESLTVLRNAEPAYVDDKLKAHLLQNLGLVTSRLGDYDGAAEYYQKGLGLAQATSDSERASALLSNLASLFGEQGDYARAKDYLQMSLPLAKKVGNRETLCVLQQNLGVIAANEGNYPQAKLHMDEALTIAQELGTIERECAIRIALGAIELRLGNYEQAENHLQLALASAEEIDHRENIIFALESLGTLFIEQDQNYSKAEVHYRKGLDLARKIGQPERIIGTLRALGYTIGIGRKDYEQAKHHLQEALDLAEERKHQWHTSNILMTQGEIYFQEEQYDPANEAFTKSLEIAEANNYTEFTAGNLYGLAQICHAQGDSSEAQNLGKRSRGIFESIKHRRAAEVRDFLKKISS